MDPIRTGSLVSRRRRAAGAGLLVLFGCVFLRFLVPEARANLEARRWPATPCRIVASQVVFQEATDGESELCRAEVRYTYAVDGVAYESDRVRFAHAFTNDRRAAHATAARFAAGTAAQCFVDPRDPRQAVLDAGFSLVLLAGLLPLAIVIAGLWLLAEAAADAAARHSRRTR